MNAATTLHRDIIHRDECGLRYGDDHCGFGCHGTDQANIIRRLHAHEVKLRQWVMVWVVKQLAHQRHRAVLEAIKLRRRTWMIVDVDNLNRDYKTEYMVEADFETEDAARARRDEIIATKMTREGGSFPYYGESSDRCLTVRHGCQRLYVFNGY